MMALKQLWTILILVLLLVIYVTLPASHHLTSSFLGEVHGTVVSVKKKQQPRDDSSSPRISSPSSPVSSSSSSSSSSSHHREDDEQQQKRLEQHKTAADAKQQQNQPPSFEPTDFLPEQEFRNPFRPLKKSQRPCTALKYTRGRWARREQPPRPVYPALGEILGCCERGHRAKLLAAEGGNNNKNTNKHNTNNINLSQLRDELFYEWVPDECDLIPWSEELFCKALRGRDLMIAGDSLNDHWHASLFYLLGGTRDIYKREGTIAGKHRCHGHAICAKFYRKPLTLHFLTNQFLAEERLRNRNYKWWKPIAKYPVLVLNSGSWMRDPADETKVVSDARWRDYMTKALGLVRRQHYKGTIIWRTTYSGHPYCWNFTKPLDAPLAAEQFPHVHPYDKYRWEHIPERNAFTTKLWTEAGAHILDVERLTNMMPLGHLGQNHPKFATRNATDCLHYCSPGPVYDTWSQLLMNLLLGNLGDE